MNSDTVAPSGMSPLSMPTRNAQVPKMCVVLSGSPLVKTRTMSNRSEARTVFSPVALEIQGRTGRFDVVEIPDSLPNVVGQIPLEDLDWVVDCKNQKLIPNPEHKNGELADEF